MYKYTRLDPHKHLGHLTDVGPISSYSHNRSTDLFGCNFTSSSTSQYNLLRLERSLLEGLKAAAWLTQDHLCTETLVGDAPKEDEETTEDLRQRGREGVRGEETNAPPLLLALL